MATLLFSNFATSTLAGAISNTSLTANLSVGSGVLFPHPTSGQYFVLTFTDAATGLLHEIVWVTNVTGDTITMVRAQEGTTALGWSAGDIVGDLCTAGSMSALAQIGQLQIQGSNYSIDSGLLNAIAVVLTPTPSSLASIVGAPIRVKIANTTTIKTPTLTVTGLGTATIINPDGTPLDINQLVAGGIYEFYYNGTNFQAAVLGQTLKIIPGNLNLYVNASTGNDSNNGLSAGTAFLTLQAAANRLQFYNLNGYVATISCTGAFPQGCNVYGAFSGAVGPASVVFSFAGGSSVTAVNQPCFAANGGAQYTITGLVTLSATGSSGYGAGYGILSNPGCLVAVDSVLFGACGQGQIAGSVRVQGNYSISSGAAYHLVGAANTQLIFQPLTFGGSIVVTLIGTPAFSIAFALAPDGGVIQCESSVGVSFSGAATGKRYSAVTNGVIETNLSGATFFPGSISGTTSTGGVYN